MNMKLICLPTSHTPQISGQTFCGKVNRACLETVKTEVVLNMFNCSHCLRVTVSSLL